MMKIRLVRHCLSQFLVDRIRQLGPAAGCCIRRRLRGHFRQSTCTWVSSHARMQVDRSRETESIIIIVISAATQVRCHEGFNLPHGTDCANPRHRGHGWIAANSHWRCEQKLLECVCVWCLWRTPPLAWLAHAEAKQAKEREYRLRIKRQSASTGGRRNTKRFPRRLASRL